MLTLHSDDKWYCSYAAQYGYSDCTYLCTCAVQLLPQFVFTRQWSTRPMRKHLNTQLRSRLEHLAFRYRIHVPLSLCSPPPTSSPLPPPSRVSRTAYNRTRTHTNVHNHRLYDFWGWHIWYAVDVESFTVLIFIKRKIPIKSLDIRTRKSQWWFWYAVLD